jgi:hypothetical protein
MWTADLQTQRRYGDIGDQGVELAEAERDAGTKCDGVAGAAVGVQKVEVLTPYRLEFPQRHNPDHLRNLPDKPLPSETVVHGGNQRITQSGPRPADNIQHGGLSSRILLKHSRVHRCPSTNLSKAVP